MSGLEAGRHHGRAPGIHLAFGGNAGMHEVRYVVLRKLRGSGWEHDEHGRGGEN